MLRGYSRHDGISNKQSAKERDRERQRERQRQERAQMLPNDDKDISTSAHDLFHAPVKVDPSVEDPTTLEIRNTLGNFENVRHILVEGPAGRSLIGVDQNSNASSVHNPRSGPLRPGQPGSAIKASIHTRNYQHNNAVNSNSNNPQNNHKPTQKVPQRENQLPHSIIQSGNTNNSSNSGVNNPPGQKNSVKKPYVYNNILDTNSTSGSVESLNNAVKVDRNVNNSSGGIVSVETVSAEITNVKDFPTRKPALERADSQLELESILKEMMDVTAPITAIQTPAKESPAKKYNNTPRRASKSEEAIFQTLHEGMNVPQPLTDMDSSESSSSGTESSGSDSEDSSSGSQGCQDNEDLSISKPVAPANSPARWDLLSFMKKDVRGTPDSSGATTTKSPKDGKPRENPLTSSTIDSEESPGEVAVKLESSVTSTSIFGKSMSSSPVESATSGSKYTKSTNVPHATHLDVVEGQYSKVPGKSPRKTPDVKPEFSSKLPPQTIPMKGPQTAAIGASKGASLSATSSEDEEKKPKEPLRPPPEKSKSQSGANKRKWRSSPSPEHHRGHKSEDDDSSPEAEKTKSQAVQDENKKNTIMKLFRPNKKKGKMDSPSLENEGTKASTGGSASGSGRGKGAKPSAPNRVSAKDSGRKSNSSTAIFVHNGDLDSKKNSSSSTSAAGKKRESNVKDSATSHSSSHRNSRKRSHKSHSSATSSSHKNSNEGTTATSNANPAVINNNPSIAGNRVKDEPAGKSHPSSLMCRIPLSVLLRRPPIPPTTTSSNIKPEKDSDKGGGSTCALVGNSDSSHRVRLHYDPSRVGSSSDHASNALHHDPVTDRQRDDPLCSDSEQPTSKSRKRPKKKPRSPKKITKKLEPDSHSHSKLEEDSGVVEVSSNVFGYTSCDSVSVSTTRTPPVELDIPPAPDSSLNPPHLPSPVVPPQPVYYSFFEKNDTQHHEDYYTRDQDTYLEEAKRLKHKADNEKLSTTQASTYLEAGLYFILTGLSMERDRAVGSQSAFTMYKDTLSLIRYIGTRFRSGRADYSNAMEAKIIVLSMRCQSLLSLKLFKIKTRETKDIVQYLADHFSKAPPVEVAPIPNSPQLSTPSPHSPTSSPAGSTGILQHTPSPHPHQNHLLTSVPRSIYSQMYKHYTNTYNLMQAHELWEAADSLVERYHMEEFFVSIDRQYGPLTLHNSLVDLVRYVKHCLKVLKICSDIS
ncbi:unnamed protein product [Allacma fusca]|uniref:AF4/FMR2 family member lilli n=1 Tax=Allacma fusca TaxID=39272 RepID=A0A8J2JB25_9HEXA|nr:unnamed protein product [Allacma fusca]